MNLKYIKNMRTLFNIRKYVDVICADGKYWDVSLTLRTERSKGIATLTR